MVFIEPEYEHSHLIGGTFSNVFGNITLRGETGFSVDRYFLSSDVINNQGIVKRNELAYVLGIDWNAPADILFSTQLFKNHVLNAPDSLIQETHDTTLTFLIRRSFSNETLISELLWISNTTYEDGLVRANIRYELNQNVNIKVGADIFYGNHSGLFGQYKDTDRWLFGINIAI